MSMHRLQVPQPNKMSLEQELMISGQALINLLSVGCQHCGRTIGDMLVVCRNDEVAEHLGLTSGKKKKRGKSRRRYAAHRDQE